MTSEREQLWRYFVVVAFLWTLFIGLLFGYQTFQQNSQINSLALIEAQTSVKKDFAYRKWIAMHGGVYVPITASTPSNPYLRVPNRDINTSDGQQLTLVNPAYALRQMEELYAKLYGMQSHITSEKLLNPSNKPDTWEARHLKTLSNTRTEYSEMVTENGEKHLRLISPLFIKQECLKCHQHQGYKVGDLRGGLSITIPMKRYEEIFLIGLKTESFIFLLIWVMGMGAIMWGYRFSDHRVRERLDLYEQNLISLASVIEQRDSYTAGHGQRVAEYSRLIAAKLGLSRDEQTDIYRAGMVHDIGKIAIPDSILLKPGPLEPIEKSLIEEHVTASYDLLRRIEIFSPIARVVRHHHERLDGSGYPDKLCGDEIPYPSQIMAVADSFDAMTTNRIYKGRKSIQEAFKELSAMRGIQFRSEIIDAAIEALSHINLESVASQRPSTPLEMERFSYFYKDPLTGAYSLSYLNFLYMEPDFKEYRQIWFITLGNISEFNKKYGWEKGDELLRRYAQFLIRYNAETAVIRFEGDDFIILRKDGLIPDPLALSPEWMNPLDVVTSVSAIAFDAASIHSLESLQTFLRKSLTKS
ncbi:MAG: DUF3365 domain-containing protein [Sulfuricurvum sp.]|jgi:HD-GYP domain-containing protein (c-di-GMP phosphodiesterase class II)|uniref:HD domain-containing phosphohydrolase n=1 Tax=Sulfuricurvum sp. TaxID=2025608 RepID=UPI0025D46026|nr:HD domain-containing phosphohydrolase [Sulfuricurvum sp.]MCK9372656.1 DUF3365 domain-containing protein [Sulfuricurvum sp.]